MAQDPVQEVLEAAGIKDFDELTTIEKETYFKLLEIAESGKISLEDFKTNIPKMRESVEYVLAVEDLAPKRDMFLKARLKNYILFEAFLNKPERAREMLEQYKKIAKNKVT
jgi:hypothetical protein